MHVLFFVSSKKAVQTVSHNYIISAYCLLHVLAFVQSHCQAIKLHKAIQPLRQVFFQIAQITTLQKLQQSRMYIEILNYSKCTIY